MTPRLGILGLTDQLVHQRINRKDYDRWQRAMETRLQQLNGGAKEQVRWGERGAGQAGSNCLGVQGQQRQALGGRPAAGFSFSSEWCVDVWCWQATWHLT